MVAYNFQDRFADHIRSGRKTHTIRRNGKRRHAMGGDMLQLYVGMRTKQCHKIIADPICMFATPILIDIAPDRIRGIMIGGLMVTQRSLEAFARSDGFRSLADMHAFWLRFHGATAFEGTMIGWEKP